MCQISYNSTSGQSTWDYSDNPLLTIFPNILNKFQQCFMDYICKLITLNWDDMIKQEDNFSDTYSECYCRNTTE